MTAKLITRKPQIASHADRKLAVARTRAHLDKLVFRSMRLEGEQITMRQATKAAKRAGTVI